MNSFLCSKADSSKGGEGPEAVRGRTEMHPEFLSWVLEISA
jgi:hypothetical protein